VHTHHIYIHATCKRYVEKAFTVELHNTIQTDASWAFVHFAAGDAIERGRRRPHVAE